MMSEKDWRALLRERFDKRPHFHSGFVWAELESRLEEKLGAAVNYMEESGGEPEIVLLGGMLCIADCSRESPEGRRSLCYDEAALASRKTNPPRASACGEAAAHGLRLLSEDMYLELQKLEAFDLKTSSWLATESGLRQRGGAIFGDCRYGRCFIYHNGAESYYSTRGFRAYIELSGEEII